MKTIYSPLHAGHSGTMELVGGSIVPGFEMPSRAEYIRARAESERLGPILPPAEHGMEAAARVHARDYLDFLPTVWRLWTESGRDGSALTLAANDYPPVRAQGLKPEVVAGLRPEQQITLACRGAGATGNAAEVVDCSMQ